MRETELLFTYIETNMVLYTFNLGAEMEVEQRKKDLWSSVATSPVKNSEF